MVSLLAISNLLLAINTNPLTDNHLLNAGLTDNGQQTCSVTDLNPNGAGYVNMGCIDGYSAFIDLGSASVTYSYPGGSGTFTTTSSPYPDGNGAYYTANVWGC